MTAQPTMTIAAVSTPEPTASADTAGGATTGMATASPQADKNMPAAMTPAEAGKLAERISEAVERLSEVDDAEVVIAGNKAAVGIEFDDQYQAGLDDRLRKIIKERIDSVISGISTVAITADTTITDAIESLGERLETMSDMASLQSDLDAIIRKINGMSA
jgi:YhcN/YlaJ family sporulation lipoprotein